MECRKELSGVKRREQIIDNLREHGEVTVKILSNQFGVSEMTIRRDLHLLEEGSLFYKGGRCTFYGYKYNST